MSQPLALLSEHKLTAQLHVTRSKASPRNIGRGVEIEVFLLNDGCAYEVGFCSTTHHHSCGATSKGLPYGPSALREELQYCESGSCVTTRSTPSETTIAH